MRIAASCERRKLCVQGDVHRGLCAVDAARSWTVSAGPGRYPGVFRYHVERRGHGGPPWMTAPSPLDLLIGWISVGFYGEAYRDAGDPAEDPAPKLKLRPTTKRSGKMKTMTRWRNRPFLCSALRPTLRNHHHRRRPERGLLPDRIEYRHLAVVLARLQLIERETQLQRHHVRVRGSMPSATSSPAAFPLPWSTP